ncbi:MAG: class I SAM-dependent methyltransferase [Ginsengibacter sp.]
MDSLSFMKTSAKKFDLIFLDGSHRSVDVYKEILLALDLLNNNGMILLHDFYPGNKQLWSDNVVISGPIAASQRLGRECKDLDFLPFGKLPWPTKLNSNVTSLAIVVKKNGIAR